MAHIRGMGVTVRDRVLLHLLEYWGLPDRGEWPAELTQSGIAGAVGITRSHVSVVLPELMRTGLVESHLGRVRERQRRVKVYLLTYQGSTLAGSLAMRLLGSTVTATDDSGTWDLPMDGLIQVHGVDMLTALASMDEDGMVDLRALKRAQAAELQDDDEVAEAGPPEAVAVAGQSLQGPEPSMGERSPIEPQQVTSHTPAPEMAPPPTPAQAPDVALAPGPTPAPASSPPPRPALTLEHPTPSQPLMPLQPPTALPPATTPQPQMWVPPPAAFWNPMRRGTGRLPRPRILGAQLGAGFALMMVAAFFLGMGASLGEPSVCITFGMAPLVFGALLTWKGTQGLWALGGKRRVWSTTALCAYGFLLVTVASMFLWDVYSLRDMLWVAGVLGVPSALLILGTGRAIVRRATFMLFLGPMLAVAFLGAELLDPTWAETPARALLGVEVGASWAFIGMLMARSEGAAGRAGFAVAGAAAGLAVVTVAWGAQDVEEGRATAARTAMLALWALTAVWGVAVRLVPAVGARAPPISSAYPVAVASASGGLLAATAMFLVGGLLTLGFTIALVAVAMLAMVWPEMRAVPRAAHLASTWGAIVAAVSVLVLAYGL